MKLPGKTACFSRAGLAGLTFEARGGQQEKLLNWCIAHKVQLCSIQANDTGFTAEIAAADYARLHAPARRCRTRLRVIARRGSWFHLRWLLQRPGLVLGAVLFCWLMLWSTNYLWAVRFVNVPTQQQQKIRAVLSECALCEGQRVTEQKLALARRALLSQSENWGWTALNFYKGRLVAERTEGRPSVPVLQKDPRPYVAAADAMIVETHIESGFAQIAAGQQVEQGQLLISGERPARDGTPVQQEPLGRVIGLVQRDYQAVRPLWEEYLGKTGRIASKKSLICPLGTIQFAQRKPDFKTFESKTVQEALCLGPISLPATITETWYLEKTMQERTLSEKAAREFAQYACLMQLYSDFPDAQIAARSAEESWQNGVLTCTMHFTFRANIAVRAGAS